MDVFISYSHKDKEWVHGELLPRIEQTGLQTFIDFRDFTRGAPSIREMERGVTECRKTLVVLTPHYVESGWTQIESLMLQTRDPANLDLRLIPLLKTECKNPLSLGALTHIDFTAPALTRRRRTPAAAESRKRSSLDAGRAGEFLRPQRPVAPRRAAV